jgi:pSer/pThr/pTyr-binding forkhead associated (FHA) protein
MEVKLNLLTGKNSGKAISVPVKHFLIGRADDCHLRPKSDAISRNHCAILVSDDEVVVRDLNSRNGTFLNGEAVDGDHVLVTGDVLKVGKIEFELVVKAKKKKKKKVSQPEPAKVKADDGSMEFDVSEWLDEADADARVAKEADPETRQYKLDETDRISLENSDQDEDVSSEKAKRPEKREPGKLPVSAATESVTTSQDAAADMLKKFFNSR